MIHKFLKAAGVTSEKAFYSKYPTDQAFFKAFPEHAPKAQAGMSVQKIKDNLDWYLKNQQPSQGQTGFQYTGVGTQQTPLSFGESTVHATRPVPQLSPAPNNLLPVNGFQQPQMPQKTPVQNISMQQGRPIGQGIGAAVDVISKPIDPNKPKSAQVANKIGAGIKAVASTAGAITSGLIAAIPVATALLPEHQRVNRYISTDYNPNSMGTGSSAIYQNGGSINWNQDNIHVQQETAESLLNRNGYRYPTQQRNQPIGSGQFNYIMQEPQITNPFHKRIQPIGLNQLPVHGANYAMQKQQITNPFQEKNSVNYAPLYDHNKKIVSYTPEFKGNWPNSAKQSFWNQTPDYINTTPIDKGDSYYENNPFEKIHPLARPVAWNNPKQPSSQQMPAYQPNMYGGVRLAIGSDTYAYGGNIPQVQFASGGRTPQYSIGQEVDLSHEEIQQLLAAGYTIQ